jgi:predicted MPP superfamily phosphohydrolase
MHTTSDAIPTELAPEATRPSRRRFLRKLLWAGGALGLGSVYATQIEPFWLDVHEVDVPIAKLPAAFEGFRIAQLTDLHAGQSVPISYLARAIDRVNEIAPDCVVVTGDLITHDPAAIDPVVGVLSKLRSPLYVTFGNHDYAPCGAPGPVTIFADAMEKKLAAMGGVVLRNRSIAITRAGARLWFVGLEDLYTNRFLPNLAFWGVPRDEPKICLSHNPDGTNGLLPHNPDLILSGHTHGGQVRLPFWGAIILPVSDRRYQQGMFALPHGQMYVSRGVGFLARVRFDCRPEIPVLRLMREL